MWGVGVSERPVVLMVDDRPENLLALEAVLEPVDADLVRANSGTEALRWLLTNECAVILLDVQMPDIDGYETARAIKGRARTRNLPIIFLTAINRELTHQLEGYGAGAVDYLAKPFEPAVLRSKVAVLVELFRQSKLIEEQNEQLRDQLERLARAEATLKRQAAELERSNAELERFAFVASHDLREPLQVVAGFLELLSTDKGLARDDAALLVERAAAGVTELQALIDELLAYARASTAEQVLEPVPLDEVVAEAVDGLGAELREAGMAPSCDPLPTVLADRWQLGRVFHHLLANAVKFRRDGDGARPKVHVGLTRRGDDWVISVRDNGIGISEDTLPRLFTIFGRLNPRDDYDGSGVGLAICRRIIERHGGTMWAESVPGRGTTVSFSLPATSEDAA